MGKEKNIVVKREVWKLMKKMRTCDKHGIPFAIVNGIWQCPKCAKKGQKYFFKEVIGENPEKDKRGRHPQD